VTALRAATCLPVLEPRHHGRHDPGLATVGYAAGRAFALPRPEPDGRATGGKIARPALTAA